MLAEIKRAVDRALARIRLPYRVRIGGVRSAGGIQTMEVEGLEGEAVPAVEHYQQFGLTSVPPAGSTGVAIPLGGRTSHSIVVATENSALRIVALEGGETAIYSSEGAKIVIKMGRIIEADCDVYRVNCKQFEVNATDGSTFNTPMTKMSGEARVEQRLTGAGGMALSNNSGGPGPVAQIEGGLDATEDIRSQGVSLLSHDHNETGSVTSAPRR